jgi:uncharacterized membrane protein
MFNIGKNNTDLDDVLKQLNMYTMQVALELETIKKLSNKFDNIDERLTDLEKRISGELENKSSFVPLAMKNRGAIKLIVERYGEITSSQLSKIIKLSRTRCNEYLVEMEKEGILVSKSKGRKKFYSVRQ